MAPVSSPTPGIRRLCADYAAAMRLPKWWFLDVGGGEDDWIRQFVARHMGVRGLRNHYAADRITLDEYEWLVDIVLRAESLQAPLA